MDNDMIIIFNQLTKSELSDCSLFENILNCHYEKFKFFYSLIKNLCLKNVEQIVCNEHSDKLVIFIHFKSKSPLDKFNKTFKAALSTNKYTYANYFTLDINKSPNILDISIRNKSISEESEIYEN